MSVHGVLEKNLAEVRQRIGAACERSSRDPSEVTLVAVTKTVGPEIIEALIELGARDIGENRVQAAATKKPAVPRGDEVRWHLIGHLQRNKVRDALKLFDIVHSVDSVRLARELERRAEQSGESVPTLLEVNVSGEESKYGFVPDDVLSAAAEIAEMPHVSVRGLMTMAPFVDDPETVRPVFRQLRGLRDTVREGGLANVSMDELSMGMTQDFEVAVEEGSTMVRIGTALYRGLESA